MSEGTLHIRDVEGPKKTGSVETRLKAMAQQVFKCQGMVERGLNANHMMITEFTNKHKMDANDIGKHLSGLYDRVDQLQGQIYDLQNQNYTLETYQAFFLGCSLDDRTKFKNTIKVCSNFNSIEDVHKEANDVMNKETAKELKTLISHPSKGVRSVDILRWAMNRANYSDA
ncbi:40S ribosomal protein S5-1 [Hordeum vulgare]|nr:40S ribosomal protein S5-1 [Hordeum vulgare]